jgi:predicted dehydrogenase
MKRVILEGCNGAWAQERYLPFLIKEAARGDIELWVVDMGNNIKLGSLQKDWQVAQNKNRSYYLNKNKDIKIYSELSNVKYVFIAAPDQFHSKIARYWLDGLAPEGIIFIEKPLDASMGAALKLKEKIEEKGEEAVFAFDHYLARARPFLHDKDYYLKEIGGVEKIEFYILEPSKIPLEREKALDKGMIFDLFCHVLALVCTVVNQDLTCSATKLQAVKLGDVKAARYVGCPIKGETFAQINFVVNNDIQVVSAVGKCVGTSEDKFMRLSGPNGKIELDLRPKEGNKFSVFDSEGKQQKQGRLNEKHVESFLKGILQGKEHPLSVPGVLTFDIALEILKIMGEAKRQIGKIPDYTCQESISHILERF